MNRIWSISIPGSPSMLHRWGVVVLLLALCMNSLPGTTVSPVTAAPVGESDLKDGYSSRVPTSISKTRNGTPKDYYLVLLEVQPGSVPEEVTQQWFTSAVPQLIRLVEAGALQTFEPAPQIGGVYLSQPSSEALLQIQIWAGVDAVQVVNEQTLSAASNRFAPRFSEYWETEPLLQEAETPVELQSPRIQGVNSFTIYINENHFKGSGDAFNTPITATLKSGSTVKSQITTLTNSSGDFTVYFTALIRGGDSIVVELAGQAPVTVSAAPLTLAPDKANDVVRGTAPANSSVNLSLYSEAYTYQWHYLSNVPTDGSGNFAGDFSGEVDILTSDQLEVTYGWQGPSYTVTSIVQDFRIPGVRVSPESNHVNGYAEPGAVVTLTLKNSTGATKYSASLTTNNRGYFYSDFESDDPCASQVTLEVGDQVEVKYPDSTKTVVETVAGSIDNIDPSTEVVTGQAPSNGKVLVYGAGETQTVTALPTGQYTADFSGVVDLKPGSYASARYLDANDNEVYLGARYVYPYLNIYLSGDTWSDDILLLTAPHAVYTATLRNALGAIKSRVQGKGSSSGSAHVYFRDSQGNNLSVVPGDQVEMDFGNGVIRTLTPQWIQFTADRDAGTISGTGPTNTELSVYVSWGSMKYTTTDADGAFSINYGWMAGGYNIYVGYQATEDIEVDTRGYVPQFTIYPEQNFLYGYGPARTAFVVTLKDDTGAVKATLNRTTQDNGYYYVSFGDTAEIAFGDTVVVNIGGFHFEQPVVRLTIAADTVNDTVYGTAPAGGWLNIWAYHSFGPYYSRYNSNFSADYAGQFATGFYEGADIRGGHRVSVQYWQNGGGDRVYVERYVPYAGVALHENRVYGYAEAGDAGNVTLQSSDGILKASGMVTASAPYNSFSFVPPNIEIAEGDQVSVQVGALNEVFTIIPLTGTVDLENDKVTGGCLPDERIGLSVYHWSGSWFSSWFDNHSMNGFIDTDAAGSYERDVQCVADLTRGDYAHLYYIDAEDVHYTNGVFTTRPTLAVDDYPAAVQPGEPVEVRFTIADGEHPTNAFVRWDTQSHILDNAYDYISGWQKGTIGQNVASFSAPMSGKIYFKVYASVDGRALYSDEYTLDIAGSVVTTLVSPVSGTTNDVTPKLVGAAPPNAMVTLYEEEVSLLADTQLMTTTADAQGWFEFNLSSVSSGVHSFYAQSTSGDAVGPKSNRLQITVDPTLLMDPVRILLTSRGTSQHLRDVNGHANLGGRIWTRTGDAVEVSLPISCTDVYTAELYVGGVYATALLHSEGDTYVGSYTPPTSGQYAVELKFRCGGATGTLHSINLLTGLIDPDGYVYDAERGLDHRLAGATVTCYMLDAETEVWLVWPAALWGQTNPQTTAADGYYSFFTLPGQYKVKVTVPGYWEYESPVLTVVDAPVHHNIPVRTVKYMYLPLVVR